MLFGKKMVEIVHELLDQYVEEGDIVVDGTMGNGFDTLKLAQLVGRKGYVYSFDIQQAAVENTKKLLENNNAISQTMLICDSHANIDSYVKKEIKAFVFNLGYLPNGDVEITTKTQSTLIALNKCLNLLQKGGVGIVLAYYGHEGGLDEKNNVDKLLKEQKSKKFDILRLENHNRANTPPILYMIQRH